MSENDLLFADAECNLKDVKVVIFGVAFDGTCSHRSGTAQAPNAIRQESYNFESYLPRYGINLKQIPFHDLGTVSEYKTVNALVEKLPGDIEEIIKSKKFLITLGGEHSLTVPIIQTHLDQKLEKDFSIIYFDAHFDYRDSYLDEKYSHACVARRLSELVGTERIAGIGIRSYSEEEAAEAEKTKLRFVNADMVNEVGMEEVVFDALEFLNTKKVYLSIDMDVLDPAYAPGVGNPEFFGLTPWQIREGIEILAPYLIGADIVEVSPPFDNGNTAALAAQFVQIIIAQVSRYL